MTGPSVDREDRPSRGKQEAFLQDVALDVLRDTDNEFPRVGMEAAPAAGGWTEHLSAWGERHGQARAERPGPGFLIRGGGPRE